VFGSNEWFFEAPTRYLDPRQSFEHELALDDGVTVSVSFNAGLCKVTVSSLHDAETFGDAAAHAVAERIVDRLAFEVDVPLDAARLVGSRMMGGATTAFIPTSARLVRSIPSQETLHTMTESGWGSDSESAAAYHLYREALRSEDSIARFLLLWNLLVLLEGGEAEADAAVRREVPDVPLTSYRGRKGQVTVVLETRDEVAHMVQRPSHRQIPSVRTLRTAVENATAPLRLTARASLLAHR
jgi:hypothetical protein